MTSSNNKQDIAKKADVNCPICKGGVSADYAPFCSKRCADVDLHRWLSGSYAIPAADDESGSESGETEH